VPNVLLEAFASGRAFVSTHVGGISEITSAAPDCNFLVQGRDLTLYRHELSKALNLSVNENNLSSYANQYSWPRCAQAYWTRLFAMSENST
jgi:glycosyltransferase involved in cell wall biosynthesis